MADTDDRPILLWLRRDLRLADNEALEAAARTGRPVIPVFVLDPETEALGAAPKWRLGLGIERFARSLEGIGSRLILRRGKAQEVLPELARQTGAGALHFTRLYDGPGRDRDAAVLKAFEGSGVTAHHHGGHVLFEPWTVETGSGTPYKVYTPYWRAVKDRPVGDPLPAPKRLEPPADWPASDDLDDWNLGAAMDRGAEIVAKHVNVGEDAARDRLERFIAQDVAEYDEMRDLPGEARTSKLSENLTYGEISIRTCWHAGQRAAQDGKAGAATFLKELVWRDFAHHLLWYWPDMGRQNWRGEWDSFPWNEDERLAEVRAWKRGRTGMRFVDAAMRELYVTGHMHNRARMIVASYLTKHLMCHWRIGCAWFEDTLVDWDPASNAMGWQWSAGSGPDATPFFRVFNPETQLGKFDPDGAYVGRWIAELSDDPGQAAKDYFTAIPRHWSMAPDDAYPSEPIVDAKDGRQRALDAYEKRDS